MAKLTKEDFISALKEMTILEVKELVDAMKEEFGVDPSAGDLRPAGRFRLAAGGKPVGYEHLFHRDIGDIAAGEAADDNATKTVVLKEAGATKMQVIKVLKEVTGLGLVEAKGLADNGGNVKENVPAKEAEEIKAQLEAAGATVELA